jgi:cold shock CspA family protein
VVGRAITCERYIGHASYFLVVAILSNFYAGMVFSPTDNGGADRLPVSALETEFSQADLISAGVIVMTTAVIRSFRPDHGLVIIKVDGMAPDVALRVCGSDRSTVAELRPGQRIQFDFQCDRHGHVFAINVTAISPLLPGRGVDGSPLYPSSQSDTSRAAGRRYSGEPDKRPGQSASCAASGSRAALEALLAAPVGRRLMERDGVHPQSVRKLIASIARAGVKSR